jgi:NitT/TauT family transport system ATP-binding protein
MLLTIDDVTKVFDDGRIRTVAMEDVSLDVSEGEFVSLVGPSGCGKSTLLRLVAGLTLPTKGEIRLRGTKVTGPVDGIGFVFQSPVLLQWRSVLKNVMFPYEVLAKQGRAKGSKQEYLDRARELLQWVGLQGFEDAYPKQLSGGMRMRASICRALLADPTLLLMDEPFGALDQLSRERLNTELLEICEKTGHTVLFVTHHVPEAVYLSDRVVVMSPRPGRVTGVVDIDLPRPRPHSVRETHEALEQAVSVREVLERQPGTPSEPVLTVE